MSTEDRKVSGFWTLVAQDGSTIDSGQVKFQAVSETTHTAVFDREVHVKEGQSIMISGTPELDVHRPAV